MSLLVNALFLKFYNMWLNQETTAHSFILYCSVWRVHYSLSCSRKISMPPTRNNPWLHQISSFFPQIRNAVFLGGLGWGGGGDFSCRNKASVQNGVISLDQWGDFIHSEFRKSMPFFSQGRISQFCSKFLTSPVPADKTWNFALDQYHKFSWIQGEGGEKAQVLHVEFARTTVAALQCSHGNADTEKFIKNKLCGDVMGPGLCLGSELLCKTEKAVLSISHVK